MGRFLLLASILVAVALPTATYVVVDAYGEHQAAREKADALQRHLRLLKRSEDAYRRYLAFVERAENFVARAQRAGAVETAWDRYEVSLAQDVSFDDLSRLLAQAADGPAYYYAPSLLDVRVSRPATREAAGDVGEDAKLTLQGAFLVRKR